MKLLIVTAVYFIIRVLHMQIDYANDANQLRRGTLALFIGLSMSLSKTLEFLIEFLAYFFYFSRVC